MCIDCYRATVSNLVKMFAAAHGSTVVADAAHVIALLEPSVLDPAQELPLQALADLTNEMGWQRIGTLAQFCGYTVAALNEINAVCITAMRALADGGQLQARLWLHRQAPNMSTESAGDHSVASRLTAHVEPPTSGPGLN